MPGGCRERQREGWEEAQQVGPVCPAPLSCSCCIGAVVVDCAPAQQGLAGKTYYCMSIKGLLGNHKGMIAPGSLHQLGELPSSKGDLQGTHGTSLGPRSQAKHSSLWLDHWCLCMAQKHTHTHTHLAQVLVVLTWFRNETNNTMVQSTFPGAGPSAGTMSQ